VTTPAEVRYLLKQASAVLEGREPLPALQRTRAAAQLGRLALERVVEALCADAGAQLPNAKMRSRLIVLDVLGRPEQARSARAAWTGLSRACHRHAYELAPADPEVRALLDHVALLLKQSAR
jgi:hypothetical protein